MFELFAQNWITTNGKTILRALIFLFIGFWAINRISKILTVFLNKARMEQGMVSFLDSASKFTLRIILIITILDTLGVNMTSIMAALGASLVTIGLALKDSLANIASGIILILNKPFTIGDYIKIENVEGEVSKIEMVFTTLLTKDNKVVIIPNSKMISSSILRQSICDLHQCNMRYTVQNLTNFKDVKRQIEKFLLIENNISQIPSPTIAIKKILDNHSTFEVSFFCEKRYTDSVIKKIGNAIKNTLKNKNLDVIEEKIDGKLDNIDC